MCYVSFLSDEVSISKQVMMVICKSNQVTRKNVGIYISANHRYIKLYFLQVLYQHFYNTCHT